MVGTMLGLVYSLFLPQHHVSVLAFPKHSVDQSKNILWFSAVIKTNRLAAKKDEVICLDDYTLNEINT